MQHVATKYVSRGTTRKDWQDDGVDNCSSCRKAIACLQGAQGLPAPTNGFGSSSSFSRSRHSLVQQGQLVSSRRMLFYPGCSLAVGTKRNRSNMKERNEMKGHGNLPIASFPLLQPPCGLNISHTASRFTLADTRDGAQGKSLSIMSLFRVCIPHTT